MRPMLRCDPWPGTMRRQQGFTLIEAVMVMVLTGILLAIVARFIVPPVLGYLATAARVQLTHQADTALRRIGRDLAQALPNSVRIITQAGITTLELIPTVAAGRYRVDSGNTLQFGSSDASFDLIGPVFSLGANQHLVFNNLGPSVPDANAYADNSSAAQLASSNRRQGSNGNGSTATISLSSAVALPALLLSPPFRVQVVETPVSYRCDLAAGTLTRYSGYGFQATQPDLPSSGSSALLARGVTACSFSYDNAVVANRAALVSLRLSLQTSTPSGTESVTLYHAVHVDNLP